MRNDAAPWERPANGFWAGLVTGLLVLSALMFFDVDITPSVPKVEPIVTSTAAANALVDDWERMSQSSWAVESVFRRTLVDGRTLSSNVFEVQRPPDRVRLALGTVDARLDGRHVICAAAVEVGKTACRDAGAAMPFDREQASATDRLRSLVAGSARIYDVNAAGLHCYRLFHRPARVIGPWGEQARLCFDRETGAPTVSEFDRQGNIDRVTATRVREPRDEDFVLPATPTA